MPARIEDQTTSFVNQRDEYLRAGRKFVSLDETSFGRNQAAVMAYAPRGQQLYASRSKALDGHHVRSDCDAL
jgi:hypothetical protein